MSNPAPAARIEVFDAWRGIAALFVCLFHFPGIYHGSESGLVRHGYLFVDFFFVLSGFVIAQAYTRRLALDKGIGSFLRLRLARLYPVHLVMLAAFIAYELFQLGYGLIGGDMATAPFTEKERSPIAIITNLFLLQGMGVHDSITWNGPSWSISTEFYAYVFFAVSFLLRPVWRYSLYVFASCVSLLVLWRYSDDFMDATYDFGYFRNIFGFCIGIGCYHLTKAMPRTGGVAYHSVLELIALVVIVMFVGVAGGTSFSLASPFIFGGALLLYWSEAGLVSRLLNNRFLQVLGKISFALYMVHKFIQIAILPNAIKVFSKITGLDLKSPAQPEGAGPVLFGPDLWTGDVILGVTLIVTIFAAWALHVFVENPLYKKAKQRGW